MSRSPVLFAIYGQPDGQSSYQPHLWVLALPCSRTWKTSCVRRFTSDQEGMCTVSTFLPTCLQLMGTSFIHSFLPPIASIVSFLPNECSARYLSTRQSTCMVSVFRVISSCPTTPLKRKPSGHSSSPFCLRRTHPSIVSRLWITCASLHSYLPIFVFLVVSSNRILLKSDPPPFVFFISVTSHTAHPPPLLFSLSRILNSASQTGRAHLLLISTTPGQAGGALGVITLEDIIEEIISEEIVDETDRYEDNQSKRRAKRMTTAAVMRG